MNEALYDLLSEATVFGLCLLILILSGIKIHEMYYLIRYNKETKRFEREQAEEALRFGRNVKTLVKQ